MPTNSDMMRTLEYVQKQKKSGKAFLQGVLSGSIFLVSALVVFLVYIPYIKGIGEVIDQREVVVSESDALQKKYDAIVAYDKDMLRSDLVVATHYIPDDMKVAELATFINDRAKNFDLKVSRLGISEDRTSVGDSSAEKTKEKLIGTQKAVDIVYLGRIEGPFAFEGGRANIFDFLDFLVTGGYATTFNEVSLVRGDGDKWNVSFSTSYYYLLPLKAVDPKTPQVFIQKDVLAPLSLPSGIPTGTPSATPSVSPTPTVTVTATPTVEP